MSDQSVQQQEYKPLERTTLTVQEVAGYIGVSKDFVYMLVRQKDVPFVRIGSRVLFKRASIEAWLSDAESLPGDVSGE